MDVVPIFQPYAHGDTSIRVLQGMFEDANFDQITLISAWVKRSAMRRLAVPAGSFQSRGGFIRVIAGLSQGGASEEGLDAALDMADEAWAIFDPSGRTFHPKMYIASGKEKFSVLLGSSNLTSAGLTTNFEANTLLTGSFALLSDSTYFSACKQYVDTLLRDSGVSRRLDQQLIEAIRSDPQIVLSPEHASANASASPSPRRTTLFSRSNNTLSTAPPVPRESEIESRIRHESTRASTLETLKPRSDTVLLWSKVITKANSMRTGAHPTGHLTLTKSNYPINASSWFRDTFFAECEWISTTDNRGRLREQCLVEFEINGIFESAVKVPLQVDHTPSWASSQNNRTTILHWGPLMTPLRNDVNIENSHVVIEKSSDGAYSLSVSEKFEEDAGATEG